MKNANANDNIISDGDFKAKINIQCVYSLTGSSLNIEGEPVVTMNHCALFYRTE